MKLKLPACSCRKEDGFPYGFQMDCGVSSAEEQPGDEQEEQEKQVAEGGVEETI